MKEFWADVLATRVAHKLTEEQLVSLRAFVAIREYFGCRTEDGIEERWRAFAQRLKLEVEMAAHLSFSLIRVPGERILTRVREWARTDLAVNRGSERK